MLVAKVVSSQFMSLSKWRMFVYDRVSRLTSYQRYTYRESGTWNQEFCDFLTFKVL